MKTRFSLLSVVVCLFAWSSNVAAQNAWPDSDDQSKLKFAVRCHLAGQTRSTTTGWISSTGVPAPNKSGVRLVVGILAQGIDLSQDDVTAKRILSRAAKFAEEKCPDPKGFTLIAVQIRRG